MKLSELKQLIREEVEKAIIDADVNIRWFEDLKVGDKFNVLGVDGTVDTVTWKKTSDTEASRVTKQDKDIVSKPDKVAVFSKTQKLQLVEGNDGPNNYYLDDDEREGKKAL